MKIKEYKNELLEKAAKLAKKMGYKVWTFETSNEYINQIFIDFKSRLYYSSDKH